MNEWTYPMNVMRNRFHWRAIFNSMVIVVFCIVLMTSLVIARRHPTPAKPLINKTDWIIVGKAFPGWQPNSLQLPTSILNSPQSTYWTTLGPNSQSFPAEIKTKPFRPSQFMAIPYGGFAGSKGISINVICLADGAQIPIATARTNTELTASMLRIPTRWCSSSVIIDARSISTSHYIIIGTPFAISRLDFYKNSFLGTLAIFVFVLAGIWGLVFIPNLIANNFLNRNDSIMSGVIAFGAIGYAMFFVFFVSNHVGQQLSCLLLLSELTIALWFYLRRRDRLWSTWKYWKLPSVCWAIAATAAYCVAMSSYNGAGPWTVNAIFAPVQWSSDNQLPMVISEYLFHGHDPRLINMGPWKISDRPPLAYGLMAMYRTISWLVTSHADGYALYYQYQLISGIVINSFWIVALVFLLRTLDLGETNLKRITLAVALTPFIIFNSVYIWPKLLGAAFGLFGFFALFEPNRYIQALRYSKFGNSLVIAAALSAFALLSHGGTAFGVIASIVVAFAYRGIPSLRLSICAALTGLMLLTPWSLWQHLEQPPGNALIKYALSGNFGFNDQNKSILATIHDAYAPLTVADWLHLKFGALHILATGKGSTCGVQELAPISSLIGLLRSQDFFYFLPSLRLLALGLLPMLANRWLITKETRDSGKIHLAGLMITTGLLGVLLYASASFDCYINHMLSYQAIIEVMTGLALALYLARSWWFQIILLLSILYGAIVWIINPIASASHLEVLPIVVLTVLGLGSMLPVMYRWLLSSRNLHNPEVISSMEP